MHSRINGCLNHMFMFSSVGYTTLISSFHHIKVILTFYFTYYDNVKFISQFCEL